MIAEIAGCITRREGRKFLILDDEADESGIHPSMLKSGERLPLYIHIPFCRKLCPFCCFNRYLFQENKAREYFLYLRRELDIYLQRGFIFEDFYFGGGTPTILMDELVSFIDYLKSKCRVRAISLETTPNELNAETTALLKSAGVNRLSLGVQSFDNKILEAMGRTLCSAEEAREKVLMARGQFDTINIDLIFNFPFQTPSQFESDVAIFKQMDIDQVTFYPLMPSPHKKNAMERKFSTVNNSLEKQYYDIILRDVYQKGYRASTVWCFSRNNRMIDEYIVDHADYIGIGSGSVSLVNGYFYINTFSLSNYSGLLSTDRLPVVRLRRLSRKEYTRYYLLTKLFGMAVDKDRFRRHFGTDIRHELAPELLALKLAGAISENDHKALVTTRGMYTVSVMMREFFASLNSLREYCIEKQV
ncbi:MAG: coproporphyrinogen III oxidase family protein [Dehalococcoidales bacterium]|nr:coproporphyrinogen III oxidase family protein [Dehalococcoidales bacterium]